MAVFSDMPRSQKAAGGLRSGGVLTPNKSDISAHLYALFSPGFVAPYPDAWFEIAFGHPSISDGAVNAAATFTVFELEEATTFAEEKNIAGFNMYVGVALRHGDRPQSGRAKDEAVTTAAKSWAEFDGEGDDKRVGATLKERDLKASITVITGRVPHLRAHLYFGLDSAPTPEKLRAANTSLMKLLGSDAVQNISRVMRLAGTVNYPTQDKKGRGYIAELVTLFINKNAPSYRIDDLVGLVGEASGSRSNGHDDHRDGGRTEEEIVALLKLSQLPENWHNAILRAIASMVGYGWSDPAIRMACAPYCIDKHKDEDLTPMIAGARTKGWDRPGVAAKPEQPISIHSWEDPDFSLLDNRRGDLPHFPLDTLASAWQDLVLRLAHGAGVLPEHVIVPLLGIVSSLIGTARRVRAAKAWSEPFTMWACVVADSGDRKTPGLRVTTRALDQIEKNNKSEVTKKRLTHETRAQNAKEVLKRWKTEREAAVNACPPQEPPVMPIEAIDPGAFVEPRLYSNDPTIEKLSTLLQAKPRGALLIRDELAGLFANMSRYSGGSDRSFWLEAWNGGRHIVERQSGSVVVEHLLMGVVGGFQPDKLSRAFDGDEDGMYGRFFYAWLSTPDYKPLSKDADEFEPALINALTHLVKLPAENEEGTFSSVDVWLSDEAIEVFEDFRKWSHANKRSLCGREQQWFVKGETNVLRLAGTLAYMAWAIIKSDPSSTGFNSIVGHLEPKTIDKEFLEDAIRLWKDFFWPHAKAVLRQIGLSDRHKNARTALNWIKAHGLREVSREDIRRHALGQKLDAEDTQKQIEGLEKSGWLRKATMQTAGRSKHRWEVNPKIFAG
jgi:hypothetical protein